MGAFGEMLIEYWGGDIKTYRGEKPSYSNKTKHKEVKIIKENEKKFQHTYNLDRARRELDVLTSNLMYRPENVNNYTKESLKNGFKRLGFNAEIQEVMWNEFNVFVQTYITKPIENK